MWFRVAAVALGFKNHAERMLHLKMAGTPETALQFCQHMLNKLAPVRKVELAKLAARKAQLSRKRKQDVAEGAVVHQWDISYLSDLLKQEQLALDDEKVPAHWPETPTGCWPGVCAE